MLKIFIGYDKRQPIAYQIARHSIEKRASKRVQIEPLILDWMPMKRRGLTDFSFTRYLVPHLCNYEGVALFIDPDVIILDDIHKILDHYTDEHAVFVVKNPLRFEWPSLMLFNNAKCKELTPEYIETKKPQTMEWASSIGELPKEWNHLVGYDKPNPNAKMVHYTKGIPCWDETKECEFSEEWRKDAIASNSSVSWVELMGNSVHKL